MWNLEWEYEEAITDSVTILLRSTFHLFFFFFLEFKHFLLAKYIISKMDNKYLV